MSITQYIQSIKKQPWAAPPRASISLETDADFLARQAASRLFDGID
jgi:hypothetical protein